MRLNEWVSKYVSDRGVSAFTAFEIISYIDANGAYVSSVRDIKRQLRRWVEQGRLKKEKAGVYSGWDCADANARAAARRAWGSFSEVIHMYATTISDSFTRADIISYCSERSIDFNENTFYSVIKRLADNGSVSVMQRSPFTVYRMASNTRALELKSQASECRMSYDENLSPLNPTDTSGQRESMILDTMDRLYAKSDAKGGLVKKTVDTMGGPEIQRPKSTPNDMPLGVDDMVYILTELEHELERLVISGEIATPDGMTKNIVLNTQRNFYLAGVKGRLPSEWQVYIDSREKKAGNRKRIVEYLNG